MQPEVKVNVVNNAPATIETCQVPDGSLDVVIDAIESNFAERASRGRGPLVKAMGARQSGTVPIG